MAGVPTAVGKTAGVPTAVEKWLAFLPLLKNGLRVSSTDQSASRVSLVVEFRGLLVHQAQTHE
jgi:hypothetical protein